MSGDSNKHVMLIIDDDRLFCDAVRDFLSGKNLEVLVAHSGAEGVAVCSKRRVDLVLLDIGLPDGKGHSFCASILEFNERTKIIIVTANPSFDGVFQAVRVSAHGYLSKPFGMDELSLAIEQALKTQALEKVAQIETYRSKKESEDVFLVGSDGGLAEIARLIDLASSQVAPVLITGETGTGKNVVAKAIHYKGATQKEAFIGINCAAIPESLIESELFGFERGAFTGAVTSRRGIFEMAEGGTLFLDEIGEMPIHLQAKLLGVLEDKKIRRIGGESFFPVDVRVIVATSKELGNAPDRTFRRDLYYRLSVLRIHLPPLRQRRQDIPALCTHLLRKVVEGGRLIRLEDSELDRLMAYDWPGNVRELKNILERATILQPGPAIRPSELLGSPSGGSPPPDPLAPDVSLAPLKEVEKRQILLALKECSGNVSRASIVLGVSLSTLKRKLKSYGIDRASNRYPRSQDDDTLTDTEATSEKN